METVKTTVEKKISPLPFIAIGLVVFAFILCKITALSVVLAIAGFVISIIGCKKRFKFNWLAIIGIPMSVIAFFTAIIVAAAGAVGNSNTKNDSDYSYSKSEKTDAVETTENETAAAETNSTENTEASEEKNVSEQTEYHVGDTLTTNSLEIIYLASGDYIEDNEFMQPEDGMKYIMMSFYVKNISDSDENISYFDFEGYADGYAVDQHYLTDGGLSATLSSGRTTTGMVIFSVPAGAAEIEAEYEVNIWTDKKVKFIYDGNADSGIVPEVDASASENAYSVGDIIETNSVNIGYISCGEYISDNPFIQPADGNHYIYVELEFENISDSDQYVSSYDFDCFADGVSCDQVYVTDESIDATLSAGRKTKGQLVFEVPVSAQTVEVEYVNNYWTSDRIVFTVN